MPMLQGCNVEAVVTRFVEQFESGVAQALEDGLNPDTLRDLEGAIYRTTRRLGDAIMAMFIRLLLTSTALDRMAVRCFKATADEAYKDEGTRCVKVHFAGGSVFAFEVTYLRRVKRRRRGRPKRHGNRGKFGKGVFPVLELLGIHVVHSKMKVTPLLEDRLIYALTASDSHEAARKLLEKWGISLNPEPLQNFFEHAGRHYRDQRDQWLSEGGDLGPVDAQDFAEMRVVVSVDGGRCRLRQNKPGRRRQSGYHGFDADWKEPKLFCIYVIDAEGRRLRSVRSIIDGVVVDGDEEVGADVLFERLEAYLRAIGIERATEVVFVADGAPWIWHRARPMLEALGVADDAVFELVDWYHVKEAIWTLSDMPTGWHPRKRILWREKALDALKAGDIDQVIVLIDELAEAKGAKKAKAKRDFFERNRHRLDYRGFKRRNLPRGSGAVESAVRRVINQRIKSNAKFWNRENVETMLLWRGFLKTDRLDDLTRWSRRYRARWWTESDQDRAQTMLAAA